MGMGHGEPALAPHAPAQTHIRTGMPALCSFSLTSGGSARISSAEM